MNKIIEQIREILKDLVKNKGTTNDLGDTIKDIFQPLVDEFKDLIEVKKYGQVLRRIKVARKSHYSSGKRRLRFKDTINPLQLFVGQR